MASNPQLVVGTAGHIDHGKSRLVWTLTGTNPDRLPEEQARGMTIDLGFAHARIDDCDIWFVDVPGHERFIRNMVAGATGVDVAMVVIAADDSIMPQTREHAELLALLGFEHCIVVLTKMDLVDDEWAAAVEDEARHLFAGVGITPLKFVRTSAETGRGFDELKRLLADMARGGAKRANSSEDQTEQRAACRWFRLPVDRAFNVPGRGAVVTGSVYHGELKVNDDLELWPAGKPVRVRGLQSHSQGRDAVSGRMRLAVNVAGATLEDARRGCELATPDYLEATRCFDARLAWLRMPGKLIKRTLRIRLHLATSETLAELRLSAEPETDELRGVFSQFRTAEPIVATWGQTCVVRDETGSRTLGGGRILRPVARPWSVKRPANEDGLRILHEGKPKQRLEEVIRSCEWRICGERRLAARAGLADGDSAASLCRQLAVENRIVSLLVGSGAASDTERSRFFVHAALIQNVADVLVARLTKHLADHPRLPGLPRGEWLSWMPRVCPQRVRAVLADWLIERGRVVAVGPHVVPKGHHTAMPPEDQALLTGIIAEIHAAAYQPPSLQNLKCVDPRQVKRAKELIDFAVAGGKLVRVADEFWLSADHYIAMVRRLSSVLESSEGLTVSAVRDMLNSSRTFVVPLLEHADSIGLTRRVGDLRKLGAKAAAILEKYK